MGEKIVEPKRDWEAMQRKLARGLSLSHAASLSGIPFEEAEAYVKANPIKAENLSVEMRSLAEAALRKGIRKLMELVDEGPRLTTVTTQHGSHEVLHNTDLEAAQTLTKLATDAIKLSAGLIPRGQGQKVAQIDLFDSAGPWELKDPTK